MAERATATAMTGWHLQPFRRSAAALPPRLKIQKSLRGTGTVFISRLSLDDFSVSPRCVELGRVGENA
jgi:hypothetical protein